MPRRPARGRRGRRCVFALLVLATVAAFAWSQRLKRDPLVLDRVTSSATRPTRSSHTFTPNGDCRFDRIRIRFRVTRSDRRAPCRSSSRAASVVITLARDRFLKRYHFLTYYWDGRSRDDGIAPPGRYKLRVKLLGQERSLVPPGVIRLHRAPRRIRHPAARPRSSRDGS